MIKKFSFFFLASLAISVFFLLTFPSQVIIDPIHIQKRLYSSFPVKQEHEDLFDTDPTTSIVFFEMKKGDSFLKCLEKNHYFLPREFYQHFSKKKGKKVKKLLSKLQQGDKLFCSVDSLGEVSSVRLESQGRTEKEINLKTFEIKEVLDQPLYQEYYFHQGVIESSVTVDLKKQHLPFSVIEKVIETFSWDIDWQRQIKQGTSIRVLYQESYTSFDKPHRFLPLHIVIEIPGSKLYEALYDPIREFYVDSQGKSLKKGFMRNPVVFDRISSKFQKARKHPILHTIRAHKGVDYAAKIGTKVKATADGTVLFAGKKGGYGNVIELGHGRRYTTVYAHLNSIAKKIKKGQSVRQGQVIGTVGMTGMATGPHLHYEFRIDNIHQDPLKVKLPAQKVLSAEQREELKIAQRTYEYLEKNTFSAHQYSFL